MSSRQGPSHEAHRGPPARGLWAHDAEGVRGPGRAREAANVNLTLIAAYGVVPGAARSCRSASKADTVCGGTAERR